MGPPKQSCLPHIVEDFSGPSGTFRAYASVLIAWSMIVLLCWYLSFGVSLRLRWDHRGSPLALGYVIKRVDVENT